MDFRVADGWLHNIRLAELFTFSCGNYHKHYIFMEKAENYKRDFPIHIALVLIVVELKVHST